MPSPEPLLTRRLLLTAAAGFALSLLLMVAVSVVGLRELAAADARLKAIVQENSVKGQVAAEMRDLLRARVISMLSIVVMNDPFEKDREMLHFYSLGEAYQKSRARLDTQPLSTEESDVLKRIDALTATNLPSMRETVDLGMEGYTFLAFEVLQRKGISGQRQLVIELDRLVSIQQDAVKDASQQAAEAYRQTRWLMLALGAAAVFLAVIGAFFVMRRIGTISATSERERTRFQTLFETNTDGIVILDRDGFAQCNTATLRMFGVAGQDDFLRLRPEQLAAEPGDMAIPRAIAEAYQHGHVTFESRCRRGDGGEFPARIDLHAMVLDGRPHLQCIIRDVSTEKAAELALKTAHAEALAAAEVKSQFVANVSHEIRTPMNGILGMTRLLLDTGLNPRQREYAEAVDNSGKALMRIINDLLDFSKIEAGRLTLEEIAFNLPEMLREIMLFYRPRAEEKGLAFRLDTGPELPTWVRGDPLRLRQVLLNLLDNAIKFTEKGEIRLSVASAGAERYGFTVADTGIGISPTALPKIFSAFSQADGSISRQFGGTGLGLTICKQLSELMRGQLTVDSTPGRGSRFRLELPLVATTMPAVPDTPEADRQPRFRMAHVLVAEDNPINQKLTRFMLENMGLRVSIAEDGRQAFERLASRHDIDLVLMDCQMPIWDGLTAAREIRRVEQAASRPHLPIIALTANAMPGFEQTCRNAGMDAYLAKPLDEVSLAACLGQWLPEHAPAGLETTVPAATSNRPFDLDRIRRLCRDDAAKVREMLDLFVTSTEALLAELAQALAENDPVRCARLAHQIKGAAAYLGADAITQPATELEKAGKTADLDSARDIEQELEANFIRLRSHIESATP